MRSWKGLINFLISSIMKKIMKLIPLFLLFIWMTTAKAQEISILESFTGYEKGGDVYLNWVISAGNTCNGILIYRAINNLPFEKVGEIPGVCGNSSSSQAFDFIDTDPVVNSKNNYRLDLGGNEISNTVTVEIIDIANAGYQLRPNPVSGNVQVYFDNMNRKLHQLLMYDLNGLLLATFISDTRYFSIDLNTYPNGQYFFSITNQEGEIQSGGKLLVQH